jgi:hypothetical protein
MSHYTTKNASHTLVPVQACVELGVLGLLRLSNLGSSSPPHRDDSNICLYRTALRVALTGNPVAQFFPSQSPAYAGTLVLMCSASVNTSLPSSAITVTTAARN